MGPLVLASDDVGPGLAALGPGRGNAAVVTSASARLDDRDAIVAAVVDPLRTAGWRPVVLDPVTPALDALAVTDLVAVAGGDPFHLLTILRASDADRVVADRVAAGIPYLGVSAGAMVVAPSLVPVTLTSPFPVPEGLDLTGLGLTATLVLPHHDRPGRAARHAEALRRHGRPHHLLCLRDGDVAVVGDDDLVLHLGDRHRRRTARPEDAAAVAAVHAEAAREAWSSFLGPDASARSGAPDERWRERIAELGAVGTFALGEDAEGVAAFAATRATLDHDLDPGIGELALFYAAPRTWGTGLARRLHEHALLDLVAAGHDEAAVWTEQRNARALTFYRREGWRPDGATRSRTFAGQPIVEGRHHIDLRAAGARP